MAWGMDIRKLLCEYGEKFGYNDRERFEEIVNTEGKLSQQQINDVCKTIKFGERHSCGMCKHLRSALWHEMHGGPCTAVCVEKGITPMRDIESGRLVAGGIMDAHWRRVFTQHNWPWCPGYDAKPNSVIENICEGIDGFFRKLIFGEDVLKVTK